MYLSMKQKHKFLAIDAMKKLLYLGEIRKSGAYHLNMINTVLIIYITALVKAE